MKVLLTGSDGYIGTILSPMLTAAGHEVVGLDSCLFARCSLGDEPAGITTLTQDVRDVTIEQLRGFDAVIHLAAISNDPLGDLNPECTYAINYRASVRLAALAREAGVPRFLFSSSCSLYGAHGDDLLDESAEFKPVTPYGQTKMLAEREISALATAHFAPTFLRNATAYGISARLRGDLVVNNLTAYAITTGEVFLKSDGTPWRPLVHIEDIARAFLAVLHARREIVHNEAFNVGQTTENYQVREVAEIVETAVEGSRVALSPDASPDTRNYRVDCQKIARLLPEFRPRWTVRDGVEELRDAYRRDGLTLEGLTGSRFQRIQRVRELQEQQLLDEELRWRPVAASGVAELGVAG